MHVKGWIAVVFLLMFAGGVLTSYAEYRFKYNLYELIIEKIFRKKIPIAVVFLFLFGCGIRGYHMAGGTGDVTHSIEPEARVVVPNHPQSVAAAKYDPLPAAACDESLWKHVYHQKRLVVKNACMSVTGITVDATKGRNKDGCRHEADGDGHCWLKLDKGQEGLLNEGNTEKQDGNLVFEPICVYAVTQKDAFAACRYFKQWLNNSPKADFPKEPGWHIQGLDLPPIGSHVRVTGAYVLDNQHGHMEIHPISKIEILTP